MKQREGGLKVLPNSPHGLVTSTRGQKPHPSLVVGDSCSYKRISRLWSDPMLARGLFRAAGSQNSAPLWQRGARSLFCGFAAVKGRGDSLTVTITAFLPGAGDTEVCVSVGTDSPAVHLGPALTGGAHLSSARSQAQGRWAHLGLGGDAHWLRVTEADRPPGLGRPQASEAILGKCVM